MPHHILAALAKQQSASLFPLAIKSERLRAARKVREVRTHAAVPRLVDQPGALPVLGMDGLARSIPGLLVPHTGIDVDAVDQLPQAVAPAPDDAQPGEGAAGAHLRRRVARFRVAAVDLLEAAALACRHVVAFYGPRAAGFLQPADAEGWVVAEGTRVLAHRVGLVIELDGMAEGGDFGDVVRSWDSR